MNEKKQLQEDHHHQLLLRDKERQEREQQLQTNQSTLVLQLKEANTLLQQAEKYKELRTTQRAKRRKAVIIQFYETEREKSHC